jgi:kynurenine 3-monooxygenase
MEAPKKVIIAGAGLVGSLLAIALKKRGHEVVIFEKRPDMRRANLSAGKSINLILTAKGIKPLTRLGLWEKVRDEITSPVVGRMMHSKAGEQAFQRYGKNDTECNFSISRAEMNKFLMTEAEKVGVQIFFESSLKSIDFENKMAFFENGESLTYDLLFGTDGTGSAVRNSLIQKLGSEASYKVEPLGTDYKEMTMPADAAGKYVLDEKSLHIWPRGNHMLMGLPNKDGSFTMTLYMPKDWFKEFDTPEKLENYFKDNYADAIPLMPEYVKEFFANPPGFLGIVRMRPWVYKDQVALLGDSAHATVPFFGQGMNSGFNDVQFLMDQMDKFGNDFKTIFENYNAFQKLEGDAVADLSLENFKEMCEKVGDEKFLLRKKVELKVETTFPEKFRSRYGQVTYTLIPYHLSKEVGVIQDQILDQLCSGISSPDQVDLKLAEKLIDEKILPWFKAKNLTVARYQP